MQIQLSDHFTWRRLFRFVLPSVVMMIFTSIYGVVDGFFVSNFVSKEAFTAVNLIMPVSIMLGALGFMLGTGGSALVARILGERKPQKANEIFSMLTLVALVVGTVLAILGIVFIKPIAVMLGAEGEMVQLCATYARINLASLPFFMLQNMFQSFLVTAEKPKLGLYVTLGAGITNMVLDALLTTVLPWGIAGASLATSLSCVMGGVIPLFYFLRKNDSLLRLVRPKFDGNALSRACANGSSEFVTNISLSVVAALYNLQMMEYAGPDGVAAYGVIMYVSFIFIAMILGYAIGTAPIIGYNLGADNRAELKNIFRKSMILIGFGGLVLTGLSFLLSRPLSRFFVGYDKALLELTVHGFRLYGLSFLFVGVGIFGSSLFTALNNGLVSAVISFMRTLVFQVATVLILPAIFHMEGVWYAVIVAEFLSAILSLVYMWKYRNRYHYL